jgi:predicted lipid-binding transport protein (Tim44 family)
MNYSQGMPNFRHMRFLFCRDLTYLGGSTGGGSIRWGGWMGGLFLCLLYVSLAVLITAGAAIHSIVLSLIATAGLVIYSLVRALTPDANSRA